MKVLVAEDEIISQKVLETLLKERGYEVIIASNGKEAWEIIQSDDPPKIVLLDWMMPEMDGIEVCKLVRELKREPYIYIILLTVKSETMDIVTGLESGADDYILKPFKIDELMVRLRAGERIINLQEELIATREALRDLAARDGLTKVWNHYTIWEMLNIELNRSRRLKRPLSVIMCDIDHFKLINDTYGHIIGDLVLQETVKRLKAGLRIYTEIGRYGGDEFLIILQECEHTAAINIAERIRLSVISTPIETPKGKINITMSFGVASGAHNDTLSAIDLVNTADQALYRAKEKGRNRIEAAINSTPH